MVRLVSTALLILAGTLAQAQPVCHDDAVSTAPGAYLFTQSGQAFQIFPGEGGLTETWLPLDRLRVCRRSGNAFELINTSRRGEQVGALYEAP